MGAHIFARYRVTTMRALLLVLDSVGCGAAPDAARYGDVGSHTLGHIYERTPGFSLPPLEGLGLAAILGRPGTPRASWGKMRERSAGKDTTTGHWEIAGAELEVPFATFERFPDSVVRAIEAEAGVEFIGNFPRSGTVVLDELGAEHSVNLLNALFVDHVSNANGFNVFGWNLDG